VFETALARLGMRADQAMMVGDSYEHDVVPAASLGMVAVLKLNEREADERHTLADYQVQTLTELLRVDVLARTDA
jgi:FMN phosphatase YigB (HAD superfamily)